MRFVVTPDHNNYASIQHSLPDTSIVTRIGMSHNSRPYPSLFNPKKKKKKTLWFWALTAQNQQYCHQSHSHLPQDWRFSHSNCQCQRPYHHDLHRLGIGKRQEKEEREGSWWPWRVSWQVVVASNYLVELVEFQDLVLFGYTVDWEPLGN